MDAKWSGQCDAHRIAGEYELRTRLWLPFSQSVQDRVMLFTFRTCEYDPLTFTDAQGRRWRPNRTFTKWDFMSVPWLAQSIVSPLAAPDSSAGHDSAFDFGGSWLVNDDGTETFVVQTMEEVNQLWMYDAVLAETGSPYIAWKSHTGVALGGQPLWDANRHADNQHRAEAMVASGQMPQTNL